jgi:hypothetical protein
MEDDEDETVVEVIAVRQNNGVREVFLGDRYLWVSCDDVRIVQEDAIPWGPWMFMPPVGSDADWLKTHVSEASEAGFRVLVHKDYGWFFGADCLSTKNWIHLYLARGLKWAGNEDEFKRVSQADRPAIVDAEFHSVWDDGVEIQTHAKVNLKTGEVQAEKADIEGLDILVEQYIVIDDYRYSVYEADEEPEDGGFHFWYLG